MIPITQKARNRVFGAAALFLIWAQPSIAADRQSSMDKQQKLIAVLLSDAQPQDKAICCKQLAIYGDKKAVPALAPLLADKDLASWARIPLEVIPGAEADDALRRAASTLEGELLVGTINSIGVRRDSKAAKLLSGKLKDADPEVVAAAAVALGNIGSAEAGKILSQTVATVGVKSVSAIAEGSILCAERFLSDRKFAEAARLYDAVRQAKVPKQKWLEATRGLILARQSAGLPLLLEQLRSPVNAEFAMALRTARELKGRGVTEALGAELDRAGSAREVMVLLALADRNDDAVLPKLLQVAQRSSKPMRMATVGLLDRFGDSTAVPVLLDAAFDADADIAQTAKSTLTRMEGKTVDRELLGRLPKASGLALQVIIELVALRRVEEAVPAIEPSAEDPDPGIRRAALSTLGSLGSEQQAGGLVRLLSREQAPADREAIEQALTAICGRAGTKCLTQVLPLTRDGNGELRIIALRALATIGGRDALAAVTTALNDVEESVRDEAVGALATWPNNWPDDSAVAEPLLGLVKAGKKRSHQVQGARGYLLYVQENTKLSNADKFTAVDKLLPLLKQAQEKRLAISALGSIPTGKTLELLESLAGDSDVAEEVCLAIVNVATDKSMRGASRDIRSKALQTALQKSANDSTRKKAGEALKAMGPSQ